MWGQVAVAARLFSSLSSAVRRRRVRVEGEEKSNNNSDGKSSEVEGCRASCYDFLQIHLGDACRMLRLMDSIADLPDSTSPDLQLDQPTLEECATIWTNTAASWIDSLTVPLYLEESQFLTTVPLAKDGGMTNWILVDRNLAANKRPILSSCESFRKRSLTSDASGTVEENIVHGIASVFCAPPVSKRPLYPTAGGRGRQHGEQTPLAPAKWKLAEIELWEPSPLAHRILVESGLEFASEERLEESIASGLWYDHDGGTAEAPLWINNEHYAWL